MYLDTVHGKGNITNQQLENIKIGNEYDVQRILFSLIKPIFPNAKTTNKINFIVILFVPYFVTVFVTHFVSF
ncbi:Uncharacterised protein [Clostridioides difficile]|nr:Uncharacterised protein [Clostridioides difficile]